MSIIANKDVAIFDLAMVHRGDAIRVRRAGDTTFRNGIITRLTDEQLEALYSNVQNNATSYLQIKACDVAVGVWEIYWTTDFITVNYNPGGGGGAGA